MLNDSPLQNGFYMTSTLTNLKRRMLASGEEIDDPCMGLACPEQADVVKRPFLAMFTGIFKAFFNMLTANTAQSAINYEAACMRARRDITRERFNAAQIATENPEQIAYKKDACSIIDGFISDKTAQQTCNTIYKTELAEVFEILDAHKHGHVYTVLQHIKNLKTLPEETVERQSQAVAYAMRQGLRWAKTFAEIAKQSRNAPEIPVEILEILVAHENGHSNTVSYLIQNLTKLPEEAREQQSNAVTQAMRQNLHWAKTFADILRQTNAAPKQHEIIPPLCTSILTAYETKPLAAYQLLDNMREILNNSILRQQIQDGINRQRPWAKRFREIEEKAQRHKVRDLYREIPEAVAFEQPVAEAA